jgi:hypothetical protein
VPRDSPASWGQGWRTANLARSGSDILPGSVPCDRGSLNTFEPFGIQKQSLRAGASVDSSSQTFRLVEGYRGFERCDLFGQLLRLISWWGRGSFVRRWLVAWQDFRLRYRYAWSPFAQIKTM